MGHVQALMYAAVVILSAATGLALTYPSHAYQTAATSVDLADQTPSSVHTYCMTVGAFDRVSPPWQVERRWPLRIGTVGTGVVVLTLGLLTASKGAKARRLKALPA